MIVMFDFIKLKITWFPKLLVLKKGELVKNSLLFGDGAACCLIST